jgi:predicted extracellular nuclease
MGLSVLGGAVKKSTQQIQEHHTASTVRAYAEKKHGGNMVKAFTEVTKHLKSKGADATNKDVIQALGKLGTK